MLIITHIRVCHQKAHSTNLNEVDDDDDEQKIHIFFPFNLGGNWKKKIVWKGSLRWRGS